MSHAEKAEGLSTSIDKDTDGYVFNHSMIRIKDPKKSLEFLKNHDAKIYLLEKF